MFRCVVLLYIFTRCLYFDSPLSKYSTTCENTTRYYKPKELIRYIAWGRRKIKDWIPKSNRIQKWISLLNSSILYRWIIRSLGSWCIKGTDRRILVQSGFFGSFNMTHHDPGDGLICLVKKCKTCFWILSDLRIQS